MCRLQTASNRILLGTVTSADRLRPTAYRMYGFAAGDILSRIFPTSVFDYNDPTSESGAIILL